MIANSLPVPDSGQFRPPSIVPDRRATGLTGVLRAMIRNPVSAIPPEAYREPLVYVKGTGKRVAFVCDPGFLEEILVRRYQDFPKSIVDERIFRPAFGNSLLIAEGEDWRWKRRLAAPYFSPAALAKLVQVMILPFQAWVETIADRNEKDPVDISNAMTKSTLEVIASTLFSSSEELDMTGVSAAISDYLTPISWTIGFASLGLPEWLPHPGKSKIRSGRNRMRKIIGELVDRRRKSNREYEDICGDLMRARDPETSKPLSDTDLVDMLLTLVAAGHETSANALTWVLYCLAMQADRQQELRAEISELTEGRPITGSDLSRLYKTDAFLKESMRLFPPAPLMARRCAKKEQLGSFSLAPDTTLFIPIYAIHRHEALWDNPEKFDYSRFVGEKARQIGRTAYMPFGAGPRICIGGTFAMMEMAAALATLVRSLQFDPADTTDCDPIHRITLRPRQNLLLNVKRASAG